MGLYFTKYHGLGNDYLVYDCQKQNYILNSKEIRKICHRNYGLGSDGILIGPIFDKNKISVRILNPDGSEAEKSGNGVRIFSRYLKDAGYMKSDEFDLFTLGGMVHVNYLDKYASNLKVSMGKLSFKSEEIGAIGKSRDVINETMCFGKKNYTCTCVSIGNPHCVIPMNNISKETVCEIGQYSESSEYFPNRINTQIVKIIDRNNIQIEIYERGAGYTLASGSSSCAAAGAVHKLGLVDDKVFVHMPGGVLKIEIDNNWNVNMTGQVDKVGTMELSDEFLR